MILKKQQQFMVWKRKEKRDYKRGGDRWSRTVIITFFFSLRVIIYLLTVNLEARVVTCKNSTVLQQWLPVDNVFCRSKIGKQHLRSPDLFLMCRKHCNLKAVPCHRSQELSKEYVEIIAKFNSSTWITYSFLYTYRPFFYYSKCTIACYSSST